jgi:uncharacterized protein YwgA
LVKNELPREILTGGLDVLEDHAKIAALIDGAGTDICRKKAQKIVYILKKRGYPFHETFHFQFYGPYSDELSLQLDELADFGFLLENGAGQLRLSQAGRRFIARYRHLLPISVWPLASLLAERDTAFLELVSTLFYFDRLPLTAAIAKTQALARPFTKDELHAACDCLRHLKARPAALPLSHP